MNFQPTLIKQVLVVRADLKMPKGKIAAQCAHASMKIFFDRGSVTLPFGEGGHPRLECEITQDMMAWIQGEFTKTVLKVNSEEELTKIYNDAVELNLPCALIIDNGRTCFDGNKTPTVVAIGPVKVELVDPLTRHLSLL